MAINKIVIKDKHGRVIASDSFAALESVNVSVDGTTGTPSATSEYSNGVLAITLHDIKGEQGNRGNGIASIEQTTVSTKDGGANEWTITENDGRQTIIRLYNGSQGSQGEKGEKGEPFRYSDFTPAQLDALKVKGDKGNPGDSGVFDPTTGNIAVIKQSEGDDSVSPMSQLATTEAIKENTLTGEYAQIDFSQYSRQKLYISDPQDGTHAWTTVATTLQSSCYIIPVVGWKSLKLHPRVSNGTAQRFQIAFLSSQDGQSGTPNTAGDTSCAWVRDTEDRDYIYDVPPGTVNLYVRYNESGTTYMPPYVGRSTSIAESFASAKSEIQVERQRIDELKDKEIKHLFLGTLVQKALTQTSLSDSTERVSTLSVMAIPVVGMTLSFKLPTNYYIGIRSGGTPDNLSSNNYWFGNGETFTFGAGSRFFRLCFCHKNGDNYEDIEVEEVTSGLEAGTISVTYDKGNDDSIIRHNYDNEKVVRAAMRNLVSGLANNTDRANRNLPTFAHTSDVHGDATRFARFAEYCDYLGVDAALVSGDLVGREPNNRMNYIDDVADTCTTPIMICIGNHDARSMSEQNQYEQIMSHLITVNESTVDAEKEYPTYYYQDFAAKKIRLIALNLYEATHSSDDVNFTQQQCEWFISALASTPQDYGVLVMFHAPETMPEMDAEKPTFYQTLKNYTGVQTNISGRPFASIIDAFIGGESAEITYAIGSTSITVMADFSSLASGVEFVAWVNGHLHSDTIGYIGNTTHMQLNLNVCCCSAVYGTNTGTECANMQDTPREYIGATQDAFNVYAIDRVNKVVKVARVGSCITQDLTERKYMTIPYAE